MRALSSSVTPSAGRGQERRGAAGEQHQQQVVPAEAPGERFDLGGGGQPARVGHRVARAPQRARARAVPCAAVETASPAARRSPSTLLGGARHRHRGLADRDEHDAAAAEPVADAGQLRGRRPRSFSWRRTRRCGVGGDERLAKDAGGGRAQARAAPAAVNAAAAGRGRSAGSGRRSSGGRSRRARGSARGSTARRGGRRTRGRPIGDLPVALVEDARGLQVLDVPQELLAVEVRESRPPRHVHPCLRRPSFTFFHVRPQVDALSRAELAHRGALSRAPGHGSGARAALSRAAGGARRSGPGRRARPGGRPRSRRPRSSRRCRW